VGHRRPQNPLRSRTFGLALGRVRPISQATPMTTPAESALETSRFKHRSACGRRTRQTSILQAPHGEDKIAEISSDATLRRASGFAARQTSVESFPSHRRDLWGNAPGAPE
jgi:hypothetical protein